MTQSFCYLSGLVGRLDRGATFVREWRPPRGGYRSMSKGHRRSCWSPWWHTCGLEAGGGTGAHVGHDPDPAWAGSDSWVPGESRGHAPEGESDPGHLNGRLQSLVALWGVRGLASLRLETIMKYVETGHRRAFQISRLAFAAGSVLLIAGEGHASEMRNVNGCVVDETGTPVA